MNIIAIGKRTQWSLLLLLSLTLTGCLSIPSLEQRTGTADTLASVRHWQRQEIDTGRFRLVSYHGAWSGTPGRLTIYLEGDGLSWITPDTPSDDPTPVNPVGLKLALAQPRLAGQVAYLARPCQYIGAGSGSGNCRMSYWTDRRFSEEVIAAVDAAVSQLARQSRANRLTLIGYSGGGAVATLVAARRTDVDRLVTVAGNLDTAAWTELQHLSPLTGSLNPAAAADRLARVQQWHFSGANDTVVPTAVARAYAERFAPSARPVVDVIAGYQHQCCWADDWPALLQRVPFNKSNSSESP